MAVDTNVLIFERIHDRLREGGSLANAIDFGYRSAFSTIFDANITTLISAVVLYAIGSGPLQGFSITLILGLMVIFGWPESTAWFVGTLIAVELIFSGWTLLLYAFSGNSARR